MSLWPVETQILLISLMKTFQNNTLNQKFLSKGLILRVLQALNRLLEIQEKNISILTCQSIMLPFRSRWMIFLLTSMEQLFNTNFYGTVYLTQSLLPMMRNKGKLLFAGARFGKIAKLKSPQLKKRFTDPSLDKQSLLKLMDQFQQDLVKGGKSQVVKKGWIPYTYMMTKLGINNYAQVLSSNQIVKDKQLLVCSFCPGFVKTQLTESLPDKGKVPVEQGISTVMHLVQDLPFEPNKDYMGKIFEQKTPQSI